MKNLRRLHNPVTAPVHDAASFPAHFPERIGRRHHRHHGTELFGIGYCAPDQPGTDQRTYTVMDGDQIRIAYQFQSVMHGIEAGLSPFADQMLHRKAVILAQGLPISRPAARQYQNNAAPGQGFGKTLDRMHQDRSAFQRQELFGQRSSHADAAAARRRLIFEELYILQLGIFLMRGHGRKITGAPMRELDLAPFWRSLPYAPTGAQRRSAEEICHDLCGQTPMNRLLQGDVGSGKTLVAAAAIWFAAQNGWQSAMLAPTEILARQHAANLADRLEPFGVNVTLLVGGMKAAEKRVALAAIADGRAGLVVGTHAVLTDSVVFKNLGLAIVDEQHRFGVRQRGILAGKANNPHLLVMSATPIPRTLGLLMYGDLDISILDELPPGRKPIKTWFITGKKRRDMYGFLEKQIAAGHQVYIVCPAIEENEMDSGMKAVKQYYEQVACPLLPGRRIGLLHGKMKPKDKDEVMQQFKAGELDVLVSTTVIEVGVDVPNATVMVIENAERFGLSALHQLRGRVGRGAANSCCILISDNEGEAVRQRLHFLCRTSDGFAVAKYDLETRGPGDFFGEAQHGLPTLHVADLVQDTRTLTVAQQEAKALLALDPNLAKPEHKALSDEVERLFATAGAMN